MGIRKYKPTTPGRRGASVADFAEVTRDTPEKSLVRPLHSKGGRNVHWRVTARHQGGGHKRAYRVIDRVHGYATDGRALALPAHASGLAPVDVRLLGVADLADRRA